MKTYLKVPLSYWHDRLRSGPAKCLHESLTVKPNGDIECTNVLCGQQWRDFVGHGAFNHAILTFNDDYKPGYATGDSSEAQ